MWPSPPPGGLGGTNSPPPLGSRWALARRTAVSATRWSTRLRTNCREVAMMEASARSSTAATARQPSRTLRRSDTSAPAQAVPHAAHRLDQRRGARRERVDLLPEVAHVGVHDAGGAAE